MKYNEFEPPKKVAVIGGAGRMGLWFTEYFKSNGFQTIVFDIRKDEAKKIAEKTGASFAPDNKTAVEESDLVILCTPLKHTPQVIHKIAPLMKKGSILAEISSMKSKTVEALRKASEHGIKPLSIHPMFGPSIESLQGTTIVLVPVKNLDFEEKISKTLFSEAKIIIADPNEHDKSMAAVLSLTYFINLTLGSALLNENIIKLKALAGTSFTLQLTLVESIINEEPELITALLFENDLTLNYIEKFRSELTKLETLIEEKKNIHDTLKKLREHFKKDPDFSSADKRRYEAYKILRNN
jgi:prephenate dehydrogenase